MRSQSQENQSLQISSYSLVAKQSVTHQAVFHEKLLANTWNMQLWACYKWDIIAGLSSHLPSSSVNVLSCKNLFFRCKFSLQKQQQLPKEMRSARTVAQTVLEALATDQFKVSPLYGVIENSYNHQTTCQVLFWMYVVVFLSSVKKPSGTIGDYWYLTSLTNKLDQLK